MILVVPDAHLAQLITSPLLLTQAWPAAWEEVMVLIQVLRKSVPSLAEALAIGLITIIGPVAGAISTQISLAYRTVLLRADATGRNGEKVTEPHLRPAEVRRLIVSDLSAGGQSGLRLAG